jgi:MSHA biogenesis protein MshN
MSLINKMLQDLDARGSPAGGGMQVPIKPVAREERRLAGPLVALGAGGALAIALAGGFGWRYLHKTVATPAPPPMPALAPAVPQIPVAAAPPPPIMPAAAGPAPRQPAATENVAAPEAPALRNPGVDTARPAPEQTLPGAGERKAGVAQVRTARRASDTAQDGTAPPRQARGRSATAAHDAVAVPESAARAGAGVDGRQEVAGQRAEGAYRRGLAELQEGRIGGAVAALEQALQIDPKHEAARQTLVGVLVEAGRADEAMRQLQLGLTLDPRQPALAMLLARLQIERGGSGIETLTRSLPYAAGNGDYQALLAGALQRQQRHREAVEQYQAALGAQPGNGVWWMGLGISLQAEKRNAEALAAFQMAKASAMLSPELQAFVERRVGQLSR